MLSNLIERPPRPHCDAVDGDAGGVRSLPGCPHTAVLLLPSHGGMSGVLARRDKFDTAVQHLILTCITSCEAQLCFTASIRVLGGWSASKQVCRYSMNVASTTFADQHVEMVPEWVCFGRQSTSRHAKRCMLYLYYSCVETVVIQLKSQSRAAMTLHLVSLCPYLIVGSNLVVDQMLPFCVLTRQIPANSDQQSRHCPGQDYLR